MFWLAVLALIAPNLVSGQMGNPSINIAKNKPTNQSSTLSWIGTKFSSSRAVDGNKGTFLLRDTCAHTQYSKNPWFYVDLINEEDVTGFSITNRGDCCGDRLDGFEVYVGNNKEDGGVRNSRCVGGQKVKTGETKKFDCGKPLKGQYVFVRLPGSTALAICEFEVYAKARRPTTPPPTTRVPDPPVMPKTTPSQGPTMKNYAQFSFDGQAGRCKYVAYHENLTTWCVNQVNQIFVQTDGKWKLIRGSLASVSAGPSGVWGVNSNGNVYYRQGVSVFLPEGLIWSACDGNLVQITSGPEGIVWGVTPRGRVHCRSGITPSNPMGTLWMELPGLYSASRVSCNDGGCWTVMSNGSLMFRFGVTPENPTGKYWQRVTYNVRVGKIVSIESSMDGRKTIAVDKNNYAHVWYGDLRNGKRMDGNWQNLYGSFVHAVPAQFGYILTSTKSEVRFLMEKFQPRNLYSPLDQIDAGGENSVCGVSGGNIYQKQGNRWFRMDGSLQHVSCSNNQIWGVNRYGEIYYRIGTSNFNRFGSDWKKIPGNLKQIDVSDFGQVYGINRNSQIYQRMGITEENPMGNSWRGISGRLNHISCGPFSCWGVDYQKSVFMRRHHPSYKQRSFAMVSGQKQEKVEVGENGLVFGICDRNILRIRLGVSRMNPSGAGWAQIMESVKDVAPHHGRFFIIDMKKQVKDCQFPNY